MAQWELAEHWALCQPSSNIPPYPLILAYILPSPKTSIFILSHDWMKWPFYSFPITCLWCALYVLIPSGLYLWYAKGPGSCKAAAIISKIHWETQKAQNLNCYFFFPVCITAPIILFFPGAQGATDWIDREPQSALWRWGRHGRWGDSWIISQKSHQAIKGCRC